MNFIAGVLSGIIASMGLGGGAVLLLYLVYIKETAQLTAQGVNILFFVPIGLLAVIIYAKKKQIKWKVCLPFAIFGLVGAALGFWLSDIIPIEYLSKIFGGFLIIAGLISMFKRKPKNEKSG